MTISETSMPARARMLCPHGRAHYGFCPHCQGFAFNAPPELMYSCEPYEATRVQATAAMLWHLGAYSLNVVSHAVDPSGGKEGE